MGYTVKMKITLAKCGGAHLQSSMKRQGQADLLEPCCLQSEFQDRQNSTVRQISSHTEDAMILCVCVLGGLQ